MRFSFRPQHGFSLVELMVTITISLLLTAAVTMLYTSSRTTARNQDDLSRALEAGRSAMYVLTRSVRQAGYLADPASWVDLQTIFPAGSRPVQGTEGAAGANDTLTITYQGSGASSGVADNRIVDCLGNPVPYPTVTYPATPATVRRDVFSIANDPANNNEPTLFCDDGSGTNRVALVSGIEAMQFLYGEDTDNPRDMTANRYVAASAVTNWYNVVAVRISILARSPNATAVNPQVRTFNLLGANFNTPADGRTRQVFSTVTNVRNLSN